MNRRSVLALGAIGIAMPGLALAQFSVLALRLVRPTGWEGMLARDQRVVDDLYVSQSNFPKADLGRKVCPALEHLWRTTMPQAAIPAGDYAGVVRRDGALGWRIELTGTGAARIVQLHVGTKAVSTFGCILVDVDAVRLLRQEYGETDSRPVLLRIQA
jgi:hypothetical protein